MNHGRIVAVLEHDAATKEAIMTAATKAEPLPELSVASAHSNGDSP